jgi:hypothetical protein
MLWEKHQIQKMNNSIHKERSDALKILKTHIMPKECGEVKQLRLVIGTLGSY